MADQTDIEWCDSTFNPWEGCQKVGPGCDHCYAETRNARFGGGTAVNWGPGAPRRRTSVSNWRKPIGWQRDSARFFAEHGRRQRVFCASLADVFDNAVDATWRADLFELIRATPDLDWLLLTKRVGNVAAMAPAAGGLPGNVWLGATIVNQEEADRDVPKLLAIAAHTRFLSMEPLLGPVNIEPWLAPEKTCQGCDDGEGYGNRCAKVDIPREEQCPWNRAVQIVVEHGPISGGGEPASVTCSVETLDWIIVGGESGPGARPMHPEWARGLRDQCAAAGVPMLFKQWGENAWAERVEGDPATLTAYRAGKKHAGRLLDGRRHDGFPA